MNKCEHCHKIYTTRNILLKHQRVSQTCLEIQFKKDPTVKLDNFHCDTCNKNFSSNEYLKYHLTICKNRDALLPEIQHSTINNISNITQNNITNNNINVNIYPSLKDYMTPEIIKAALPTLEDVKRMMETPESIFAFLHSLVSGFNKPLYLCTDRTRKNFCLFEDGIKIPDDSLEILRSLFLSSTISAMIYPQIDSSKAYNILNNNTEYKPLSNYMSLKLPKTIEERMARDDATKMLEDTEKMFSINEDVGTIEDIMKFCGVEKGYVEYAIKKYYDRGSYRLDDVPEGPDRELRLRKLHAFVIKEVDRKIRELGH